MVNMEDSAILVDENKKTSSTQKKNITIVYVHGFRGGKNTFWDFPALLKKSLETYNIEINNKIFDAFETKGDFDIIVNKIIDWLYEKTDNEPIVLMGHSMGGILVADVFRKITKGSIEKYKKSSYQPNIVGIFGFDSPYFGLSSSVYGTGLKKLGETVSAVGNYVSSYFSNNEDNTEAAPNANQSRTSKNNPDENKKSGWGLGGLVLGAAALGYMIYNNENAREAVRDSSNRIITESTEYISDYKQFLEPLSNVDEQYDRINDLIKYIKDSSLNGKNQFIFKNYYPLTVIKSENGSYKQHFILLPTDEQYLKFFDAIDCAKDSPDVIYSHTNMFKVETNAKNVQIMADKCTNDIYQLVKNLL